MNRPRVPRFILLDTGGVLALALAQTNQRASEFIKATDAACEPIYVTTRAVVIESYSGAPQDRTLLDRFLNTIRVDDEPEGHFIDPPESVCKRAGQLRGEVLSHRDPDTKRKLSAADAEIAAIAEVLASKHGVTILTADEHDMEDLLSAMHPSRPRNISVTRL